MLFNFRLFARIYYFLILLLLITAGGTIGYMIIEEWSFTDSFYMTVITISTVGFSEVNELSSYGKFFTAFLIVSSFGTFAYAVTSITTYLVGGEYKRYFKYYKTMKDLSTLRDHVIICGYGRVGKQVASDLEAHETNFVVIEQDELIIGSLKDQNDILFLHGDSTDDEILKMAQIQTARAVITCLPKDADNTYVVLSAREFKKDILIVSRASSSGAVSKLRMAGANNVIMPDTIGGSHMASLIANPDVMEFLDTIRVQGYKGANIESIGYDELPVKMQGMTIEDLDAQKITGVKIIGYKAANGEYMVNPEGSIRVEPGSRLFVLGTTEQIRKVVEHFHLSHS